MDIRLKFKCSQDRSGGDDVVRGYLYGDSILQVKYSLFRDYPLRWPLARSPTNIRFIFLGKELKDDMLLSEIRELAKFDPVAIHLLVRKSPQHAPTTPTVHYATSPVSENSDLINMMRGRRRTANDNDNNNNDNEEEHGDEEQDPHFHAVTLSERELSEFRMIFEHKKDRNGKIAVQAVANILKSYWRFIHREGFEFGKDEFPEERLEKLKEGVLGEGRASMTMDQFLTVFYLFDNDASEEACIHGEKNRVSIATSQLHSALMPETPFYRARFNEIFKTVSGGAEDQTLSCKQMELLYYLYSAYVLDKLRVRELVSKVQARVRMKIQSAQYSRMLRAAKKLQNRFRNRNNMMDTHRVEQFLKTLCLGEAKIGVPH